MPSGCSEVMVVTMPEQLTFSMIYGVIRHRSVCCYVTTRLSVGKVFHVGTLDRMSLQLTGGHQKFCVNEVLVYRRFALGHLLVELDGKSIERAASSHARTSAQAEAFGSPCS